MLLTRLKPTTVQMNLHPLEMQHTEGLEVDLAWDSRRCNNSLHLVLRLITSSWRSSSNSSRLTLDKGSFSISMVLRHNMDSKRSRRMWGNNPKLGSWPTSSVRWVLVVQLAHLVKNR